MEYLNEIMQDPMYANVTLKIVNDSSSNGRYYGYLLCDGFRLILAPNHKTIQDVLNSLEEQAKHILGE